MNKQFYIAFCLLIWFALFCNNYAQAGSILRGKISSAGAQKEAIPKVAIINKTQNDLVYSADDGSYSLSIFKGDTVTFERLGYFTYQYVVGDINGTVTKNVILSEKKNVIEGVKVISWTKYQKDSFATAKLFEKANSYEQNTSLLNPITSLYEQFSKKYRDLRKFQAQFADAEKQKFIDTKYTYELVSKLTKLQGDSAAYFMNTYPMEYNFARTENQMSIMQWIKHNYKEYVKMQALASKMGGGLAPKVDSVKH